MVTITGTNSVRQNEMDLVGFNLGSATDSITAKAGGGQTNATQLTAELNRISVCATTADSVKLPASVPGMNITIINDGAAAAQVFGTSPDTIDAVATATGVPLTNAKRASFSCVTAGKWQSMGGGVTT